MQERSREALTSVGFAVEAPPALAAPGEDEEDAQPHAASPTNRRTIRDAQGSAAGTRALPDDSRTATLELHAMHAAEADGPNWRRALDSVDGTPDGTRDDGKEEMVHHRR